ncbi:MAG: Tol-Pal system beta propeller repeat protein TolB [Candidatus Anaerobiospirillum merdipullorum]|uniref:Tol-Pal system protein TolB n=1 Tax=Candidatus Anaerobiospirillum merdipullorum TaxID=2838450 RepID=A0A9E2KMU4_9GAMM|nr:Tol-Pal system beta propeller repeat protein TolB [Candidatus Anaerobiospirillum merdipullorum]
MRFFRQLLLAGVLLCASFAASAALQIQITGGINEGRKIAVLPFAQPQNIGTDVAAVVSADLMRSGKFSPLAQSLIPTNALSGEQVNLDAFAQSPAEAVVFGKVYPDGNTYQVEFQLVGLKGAQQGKVLAHYRGASNIATMRQAAHRVSDRVYQHLTGQPGAFRTRIAYIVYKHGEPFPYQLMTADYDGYNEVPILKSTQPIMTPSWAPDGSRLVYVSFERRVPTIFIQDINSKERTAIASYPGLNSSPSWSPDGTKIAMTLSYESGQPDIYYYDLQLRKLIRVTSNPAIDTEPTWSADSKALFFTSERGGGAQIYKFDFNTRQTERVTYQGRMNLSAKAIPGSNALIVITNQNGYRVARMDVDGSIYMLTTSSLDESPSVAPNGSMVIYSTVYQGRKGLAIVSADGRFKANLPSTSGEVSAPAWGPLLEK